MKKYVAVLATLFLAAVPAFAHNHASQYQVGTFSQSGKLNDGSYLYCEGGSCESYGASHHEYFIMGTTGEYAVEAPYSSWGSLGAAMERGPLAAPQYKDSFLDELSTGDKVLFYPKCKTNGHCTFWIANPTRPGKEFRTIGFFKPYHAASNILAACKDKNLSAAVRAQVCGGEKQ